MCGIYGSLERNGCSHAAQKVFSGLKDVKYRGYDSFGIAWAENDDGIKLVKDTGHLPDKLSLPEESRIAIGHTRWATHGGVTAENAHPHTDCQNKVAVVHNGIIENYQNLNSQLSSHNFKSQTDTEVIAHLIEEEQRTSKHPFSQVVKRIFAGLEGNNALLATNGRELVAIKRGSPLIVGVTETGYVASSDTNSLLPHTNKLHYLLDNEMVVLDKESNHISTVKVPWEYQSTDLGGFRHYMEKEISQIPQALENLLKDPEQIKKAAELIKTSSNTHLIGCGSAYFASLLGEYLFAEYGKKLALSCSASEFSTRMHLLSQNDLVISTSQSGETIDLLDQVYTLKSAGIPQLALLNAYGSTLYREVSDKVMFNAGLEIAVASTKCILSMQAAFILLSHATNGEYKLGQQIIEDSIKSVQDILDRGSETKQIANNLLEDNHLFVLGRKLSYPIALETALKIKETSYKHAEGFAGGELKHGVMALIEEKTPVIVFTTEGSEKQNVISNAQEVKARGAQVIGIGTEVNSVFDYFFPIKKTGVDEVIPKTVFGQLLAYFISTKIGLNPDTPRNLAKSVTVK
jgi:glutamine---fructose-6-phosphate transaminase (isomerizing)